MLVDQIIQKIHFVTKTLTFDFRGLGFDLFSSLRSLREIKKTVEKSTAFLMTLAISRQIGDKVLDA